MALVQYLWRNTVLLPVKELNRARVITEGGTITRYPRGDNKTVASYYERVQNDRHVARLGLLHVFCLISNTTLHTI